MEVDGVIACEHRYKNVFLNFDVDQDGLLSFREAVEIVRQFYVRSRLRERGWRGPEHTKVTRGGATFILGIDGFVVLTRSKYKRKSMILMKINASNLKIHFDELFILVW